MRVGMRAIAGDVRRDQLRCMVAWRKQRKGGRRERESVRRRCGRHGLQRIGARWRAVEGGEQ